MTAPLRLPADLTIYSAAATRQHCLNALAACDHDTLCLDAAAVEDVDSIGLQLLVALRHTLQAQGRTLTLQPISPRLHAALTLTGLQAWLTPETSA